MAESPSLGSQVELLHQYHLDLWREIEAQLQVLRAAQDQIQKLRDARAINETPASALRSVRALARLVQVLKGRVGTLGTTVAELESTVNELVVALSRR